MKLRSFFGRRSPSVRWRHSLRWQPMLERLPDRITPRVTTAFSGGFLEIDGDGAANTIQLTRNAAGAILLNGKAINGQPTVTNTSKISIAGGGGNDVITVAALTGFAGAITLDGGTGNDTLTGGGGNDVLLGGSGSDSITGGAGADFIAADRGGAGKGGGEVNNGTLIDNDIPAGTIGQFAINVGNGGGSGFGGVTAQGKTQLFTNADFIFDFRNFVDVGSDGGAISLAGTTISSQAALVADDVVISSGSFAGQNGTINWKAETRIEDGSSVVQTTITFTSASALGNLRFVNYLDEDVLGPSDDILDAVGTPGQPGFQAFTLDNAERVGFSQGGVYTPGSQLVNATYNGWAADQYSELVNAITGAGTSYSIAGNIDTGSVPPFNDPALGQVFGPRDVTTAFAWSVNPSATTATITTFLILVEQDPGTGPGNDTVLGGGGNDILSAGEGDDLLDGGEGADLLSEAGDLNFTLTNNSLTGLGSDVLVGVETAALVGGGGDNIIDASAFTLGAVSLVGGGGNDRLTGSAGRDNVSGGDGDDTLKGGLSNDTIDGGNGTDLLAEGGPGIGVDTLTGIELFPITITGTAGNDVIDVSGKTEPVVVDGGLGSDTIIGGSLDDTFIGGEGDDSLVGGGGKDLVVASGNVSFTLTNTSLQGQGNDILSGIEEANLTGGAGNNVFDVGGFTGHAALDGVTGTDRVVSSADIEEFKLSGVPDSTPAASARAVIPQSRALLAQSNGGTFSMSNILEAALTGGNGNNKFTIDGFTGAATLDGGAGRDRVTSRGSGQAVLTDDSLVRSLGGEFSLGGMEEASLVGGDANDILDAKGFTGSATLDGGGGNDTIKGGGGADVLIGGKGKDTLVARGGNDILRGLGGNDTLNGGRGRDTTDGGGGTDICLGAESKISCEF